jgi:hypothetical protein
MRRSPYGEHRDTRCCAPPIPSYKSHQKLPRKPALDVDPSVVLLTGVLYCCVILPRLDVLTTIHKTGASPQLYVALEANGTRSDT